MGQGDQPRRNADELADVLARTREGLAEVADKDQRIRRALAIEQVAQYVALLRDASAEFPGEETLDGPQHSFAFKLELEDGRWNVEEKTMPIAPKIGDVLAFGDGSSWRVRTSRLVRPRPKHKPPREFFVCAPAA